jgi:hypothetical protein
MEARPLRTRCLFVTATKIRPARANKGIEFGEAGQVHEDQNELRSKLLADGGESQTGSMKTGLDGRF